MAKCHFAGSNEENIDSAQFGRAFALGCALLQRYHLRNVIIIFIRAVEDRLPVSDPTLSKVSG